MAMKRHLLGVDIGGTKIALLAREVGSEKTVYADKLKTPSRAVAFFDSLAVKG
jgi:hypothetical protein